VKVEIGSIRPKAIGEALSSAKTSSSAEMKKLA
jgi:hypothetical protein